MHFHVTVATVRAILNVYTLIYTILTPSYDFFCLPSAICAFQSVLRVAHRCFMRYYAIRGQSDICITGTQERVH